MEPLSALRLTYSVPESTRQNRINQIKAYGARMHLVGGSRKDVADAASAYSGFYARSRPESRIQGWNASTKLRDF